MWRQILLMYRSGGFPITAHTHLQIKAFKASVKLNSYNRQSDILFSEMKGNIQHSAVLWNITWLFMERYIFILLSVFHLISFSLSSKSLKHRIQISTQRLFCIIPSGHVSKEKRNFKYQQLQYDTTGNLTHFYQKQSSGNCKHFTIDACTWIYIQINFTFPIKYIYSLHIKFNSYL